MEITKIYNHQAQDSFVQKDKDGTFVGRIPLELTPRSGSAPAAIVGDRWCHRCGAKLSRYNLGHICRPCQHE